MRAAAALFFLATLGAAQSSPPQSSETWRYDLRPGDHLTYAYSLQRSSKSKSEEFQTELRLKTHVLVAGEQAQRISLGVQRNREVAELTEYLSKGKDRLAREKVDFDKRMQQHAVHFSEAMEISPDGKPRYQWELARESSSHILGELHEVVSLPARRVSIGEVWRDSAMGLEFRWINDENVHGKLCHHVEGVRPETSLKLSYWWSPESGVMEKVVLDGSYSVFDGVAHDTARMELESKTRDESLDTWLDSPDTRLGILQALLLTPSLPISSEKLTSVLTASLGSDDPAATALALAIVSRRKIELPAELLAKLRTRGQTQVVAAEVRLLDKTSDESSVVSGRGVAGEDECPRRLPSRSAPVKFGTSVETTSTTKDASLSYLLRIPLSYREDRPSPLLVYLSGGAGLALDGVSSAEDVVAKTDYLVLYPQATGYWWSPDSARLFDEVLRDVLARYAVDPDRVYLAGFSNGGTGAIYYAMLWPHRFAAVVSLMGAGQCMAALKDGLANLKNVPALFVHGENDNVIQPDCSKTTDGALADLQPVTKPQLHILPGRGHDITLQTDDGLTLAFFKDKVRNPFPSTVELDEFDAFATRSYWVEVLDGTAGKSGVVAHVKPDNTIEIHSHDVRRIRLHLRKELLSKAGEVRVLWNGKKVFSGPLRDYCSAALASSVESLGDPKLDLDDVRDLALP